ncbi:energy-coupling factor transport system substrate-specific component [Saccharothrix tamanrassetensis]|uniref:Energy-coupling factor transport system substrate-specific component n=1 Tax=Saccharothrix tamanrassetensis TaxID=1051531 RepID=A0A841C9E0_9PSEU|nr:ECF transporter S component [Saccharothrix tamanrassetensis]MBB5953570.1 energy-coupling factor transport system substrate-specific component [Saccharothrix tamanrassetensis]
MTAPVRLRPRATAALVISGAIGIAAFGWPLLLTPDAGLAHGTDAPWIFALLLPLVLAVVLAEISEGGMDSKAVAMLGVLSALGAAIRPLGAGTAGIETVFFVLVLGGRVFGPGFGFVLGNTMLFTSALLTGGIGPWLPYQMLGAAWVALGAGLLPPLRGRAEPVLLAAYSAAASLVYGLLLNLSFWPFALGAGSTGLSFQPGGPVVDNLVRLLAFSLATSLGWDIGRAVTTTVLVLITGPVLLRTLRRAARKAAFDYDRGRRAATSANASNTSAPTTPDTDSASAIVIVDPSRSEP